jgi:hypothetical protein
MRKEPAKRYATAEELAEDLRRWLHGEPIRARPIGPLERLAKWARRNPALTAALVIFAVGAMVSGWLALSVAHRDKALQDSKTKLGETETKLGESATKLGEAETKLGESTTKLGQTRVLLDQSVAQALLSPHGLQAPPPGETPRAAEREGSPGAVGAGHLSQ